MHNPHFSLIPSPRPPADASTATISRGRAGDSWTGSWWGRDGDLLRGDCPAPGCLPGGVTVVQQETGHKVTETQAWSPAPRPSSARVTCLAPRLHRLLPEHLGGGELPPRQPHRFRKGPPVCSEQKPVPPNSHFLVPPPTLSCSSLASPAEPTVFLQGRLASVVSCLSPLRDPQPASCP